ncbi:MAG: MATE family efflux transporter [Chloroflexi bacterium]|nr:MATE family efflux transporter [Chloroflexota bacterium]
MSHSPRPSPAQPAAVPFPHRPLIDERAIPATVNRLALPIMLENLLQMLVGLVDMGMVSRLGAEAIAGVGAANQIGFVYMSSLGAITIGTTALVARLSGGGHFDQANHAVKQSILLGLALSIPLSLVNLLFPELLIAALGAEPRIVELGATYLRIAMGPAIFFVLTFVAGAALRGAGDSRTPMYVTGLMNVINVVVAYGLIFGHFGLPALGVAGSAWGALSGRVVGCALLLGVLLRGRARVSIADRAGWAPDVGVMRRVLRVGIPSMIEQLALSLGMTVYSAIAISLGTVVFAVQRIAFMAMGLSFMPAFGYAIAATALTGQSLGANRPDLARRTTRVAIVGATIWMTIGGFAFFFLGEFFMRLFTDDPAMVALGVVALRVMAFTQPFQAMGQVLAGSLRGAGDTRFPMAVTAVSIWAVRIPMGYLFAITFGWGLPGLFGSAIVDGVFRAALNYVRYRAGKWQSISI